MQLPNIPFELILVILFVALPALGNLIRHLGERGQQSAETTRPARPRSESRSPVPTARPTTIPATTASTSSPPSTPPSTSSGDVAGTWLEEAQRRVREAQQEESDRRGRRNAPPRARPPAPAPAAAPKPAAPRPAQTRTRTPSLEGQSLEGGSLERDRPAYSRLESGSLGSGSRESTSVLETAPAMNVQRLGGGKRATIAQAVRLDEQSVMNGFIWHQILSPPLSKSRRTRLSRRQP